MAIPVYAILVGVQVVISVLNAVQGSKEEEEVVTRLVSESRACAAKIQRTIEAIIKNKTKQDVDLTPVVDKVITPETVLTLKKKINQKINKKSDNVVAEQDTTSETTQELLEILNTDEHVFEGLSEEEIIEKATDLFSEFVIQRKIKAEQELYEKTGVYKELDIKVDFAKAMKNKKKSFKVKGYNVPENNSAPKPFVTNEKVCDSKQDMHLSKVDLKTSQEFE